MTHFIRFMVPAAHLMFLLVGSAIPSGGLAAGLGIQVERYPGGQVRARVEIDRHGQPHGWTREYTEDGILKAEKQYDHGLRHGLSRLYYPTGELMTEWNYQDGLRHGPSTGYFKDGGIKDKGSYREDKLEGPVLMYYPSGTLKTRMNFEDDRPEGPATTYNEKGQVQFVVRYRKGRVVHREDHRPK